MPLPSSLSYAPRCIKSHVLRSPTLAQAPSATLGGEYLRRTHCPALRKSSYLLVLEETFPAAPEAGTHGRATNWEAELDLRNGIPPNCVSAVPTSQPNDKAPRVSGQDPAFLQESVPQTPRMHSVPLIRDVLDRTCWSCWTGRTWQKRRGWNSLCIAVG